MSCRVRHLKEGEEGGRGGHVCQCRRVCLGGWAEGGEKRQSGSDGDEHEGSPVLCCAPTPLQ